MKVSELGEFGLIDLLAEMVSHSQDKRLAPWHQLTIGIGDDAAVWQRDASTQLATIDSLIQDIHFSLNTTSWKELGWKALAVNLSDIAAMGGVPEYVLISLALPEYTKVDDVVDLYRGMIELAQQSEVAIVGGDTCRSPVVSVTITVLGSARDKQVLTRSGARPGDKVAVTGYLGSAAAGLEMLTHQLKLDLEAATYLREAFLHPLPRITEGRLLVRQGVKAAIDISDGLVADLRHVCQASQVSARVEIEQLPVHTIVKRNFGDKSVALALTGGEDYELLFTANAEVLNRVKKAAACPVTVIGEIMAGNAGKVNLVDIKGNPFHLLKTGWDHFTTIK